MRKMFRRLGASLILIGVIVGVGVHAHSNAVTSLALSEPHSIQTNLNINTVPLAFLNPTKTVVLKKHSETDEAFIYHRVQSGDTLSSIANLYGISARDIKLASNITRNTLKPNVTLRIPLKSAPALERESRLPPGIILHTLMQGQTLSEIETRYGVSRLELVSANPGITSMDRLSTGAELFVPTTQTGLLLRLNATQSLEKLATQYGIPLTNVVAANGLSDPRDALTGDYVLLPGVRASSALVRLEHKRSAEIAFVTKQRAQAAENQRVQAAARRRASIEEARKQTEQRSKREAAQASRRDSLRSRQRASVTRVQRAAVYVRESDNSANSGYGWPMRSFVMSSSYGRRGFWIGRSNFHTGIDLAAPIGTPIYAASSGTVIEAGYGSYGLNARIAIGNGTTNIYGHMSRIAVSQGQFIQRGSLIGFVGCSGICTGPHLHFEVQVDGSPRNPMSFLP